MGDLLGLKATGGEIKVTHQIDTMSALKIGLALFASSLIITLIAHFLKGTKKG